MSAVAAQHACLLRRTEPHELQTATEQLHRNGGVCLESGDILFHACVTPAEERDSVMPPLSQRITPVVVSDGTCSSDISCQVISGFSVGWCVTPQRQYGETEATAKWLQLLNDELKRNMARPGAAQMWQAWKGLRFVVLDMAFQNQRIADVSVRNIYGIAGVQVYVDRKGPQVRKMFAMHTPAAPLNPTPVGCMVDCLLSDRIDAIFCNPHAIKYLNHPSQPWSSVWSALPVDRIMSRFALGSIPQPGMLLKHCPMGHTTSLTVACHVCQLANNVRCLGTQAPKETTCRKLLTNARMPSRLGCMHSRKAECSVSNTAMWYPGPVAWQDTCLRHFGPEWTTRAYSASNYVQTEWVEACRCAAPSVASNGDGDGADGDEDDGVTVTVLRH